MQDCIYLALEIPDKAQAACCLFYMTVFHGAYAAALISTPEPPSIQFPDPKTVEDQ